MSAPLTQCRECGVRLDPLPELCPLCGAETNSKKTVAKSQVAPLDTETYQSRLRALREQLHKLRSGDAEAV
jgi:uncharacterized OB-fold protein